MNNEIETLIRLWRSEIVSEVDFIPSFDPPFILYHGGTIGISMKIVKELYFTLYNKFLHLVRNLKTEGDNNDKKPVMDISLALLTVKADLPMAYNFRKSILIKNQNWLGREIGLMSAIFSKHPKSPSGWEHIRWCMKQRMLISGNCGALSESEMLSAKELCRRSSEKYPRNYYAWMHRLWLLSFMDVSMLEEELHFTQDWIWSHPSDHSGVNHRLQVIIRLLSSLDEKTRQDRLQELMKSSTSLINGRPGYDSLWIHRKHLLLFYLRSVTVASSPPDDHILSIVQSIESGGTIEYYDVNESKSLFVNEVLYALSFIGKESIWGNDQQQRFAIYYAAFVISRWKIACCEEQGLDYVNFSRIYLSLQAIVVMFTGQRIQIIC